MKKKTERDRKGIPEIERMTQRNEREISRQIGK